MFGMKVHANHKGGWIKAQGQGTTSGLSVGSNGGSITAVEETATETVSGTVTVTGVPGTGVMSNTTIGSSNAATGIVTGGNSGNIAAGSISGMSVTSNSGSIAAAGAGTMTHVHVDTNSGSINAKEDHKGNGKAVEGTGVMTNINIGANWGKVFAGSMFGMKVHANHKGGWIKAQGQGTTSGLSVGSNGGSITAVEETATVSGTPTAVPGTGVMSNTTIGTVNAGGSTTGNSGTIAAGSISGMSVTSNSGSIAAAGAGTITHLQVGTNSGSIKAKVDTSGGSGALNGIKIGQLTMTGTVSAANANNLAINTVEGSIQITDSLSNLTVGTVASSATISAGKLGVVTAQTAGPSVTFVQGGVTRTLSLTSHSGMALPASYEFYYDGTGTGDPNVTLYFNTASTKGVGFDVGVVTNTVNEPGSGFDLAGVYAAGQAGVHNVVVGGNVLGPSVPASAGRATISHGTLRIPVANGGAGYLSAPAVTLTGGKFTTAATATAVLGTGPTAGQVVAIIVNGGTGYTAVPTVAIAPPLAQATAGTPRITGGTLTIPVANGGAGYLSAPAVTLTGGTSAVTATAVLGTGATAGQVVAINVTGGMGYTGLLPTVTIAPPTALAALAFFGLTTSTPGGVQLPQDTVAVAAAGNLPAGSIEAKAVPSLAAASFAGVPAATACPTDALVALAAGTSLTQANDTFGVFIGAPGPVAQFLVTGPGCSFDPRPMLFADQTSGNTPVTATDTVVPSSWWWWWGPSVVTTVAFHGNGGSLTTAQPITTAITSDGSLGDLVLFAPQGLTANVTAPSIAGNIDVPWGGISGTIETTRDLGSTFTSKGKITSVTSIQTGGVFTGQIIVGGNLISQVELACGMYGVIAVQGDVGTIQPPAGNAGNNALIRFGGISASGGFGGLLVAVGNVFGDITITGGLSGRIAVKGNGEYGLSSGRDGILGNVSISGGIRPTGAIVSAGLLGDTFSKTQLSISGNDSGILVAVVGINYSGNPTALTSVFTGMSYAAAVDAIFTNNHAPLEVTSPGDLELILKDLVALTVIKGKLTGPIP
jgi:hypothetical protein